METQKTLNSQNIVKKEQNKRKHAPWFQIRLQNSMLVANKTDT